MHEEEKKFRAALVDVKAGIAGFGGILDDLEGKRANLAKGVMIMSRELGATIENGRKAMATAQAGADVIDAALLPPAEDDDEQPQPVVAAPTDNPKPSSTAAANEAPAPSNPVVESATLTEQGAAIAEEVHAE